MTYNAFGVHYQMIGAFSGSKATKASFLSGDGDAIALSASDVRQIKGKAMVVVLVSDQPFGQLPGVPTVVALARQEKLAPQTMKTLQAMVSVMDLGHAFVAPPGVPADRLAALRSAFGKAVQDPDFCRSSHESRPAFRIYAARPDEPDCNYGIVTGRHV